jgi:hypothetical protein
MKARVDKTRTMETLIAEVLAKIKPSESLRLDKLVGSANSSPGACTPQIAAVSREQGSTSPSPEGVKSGVDGALVGASYTR